MNGGGYGTMGFAAGQPAQPQRPQALQNMFAPQPTQPPAFGGNYAAAPVAQPNAAATFNPFAPAGTVRGVPAGAPFQQPQQQTMQQSFQQQGFQQPQQQQAFNAFGAPQQPAAQPNTNFNSLI
jgi:hypothetical protein